MGRFIETVAYDAINNSMRAVPELTRNKEGVIKVGQGKFVPGNRRRSFVSEDFVTCSALLLQGGDPNAVGVFHVLPAQGMDTHPPKDMEILADGQVIVIDGSESTVKPWLLKGLETDFGIKHVWTLRLDTHGAYGRNMPFHIGLASELNEFFIARNSHQDLSRYYFNYSSSGASGSPGLELLG